MVDPNRHVRDCRRQHRKQPRLAEVTMNHCRPNAPTSKHETGHADDVLERTDAARHRDSRSGDLLPCCKLVKRRTRRRDAMKFKTMAPQIFRLAAEELPGA